MYLVVFLLEIDDKETHYVIFESQLEAGERNSICLDYRLICKAEKLSQFIKPDKSGQRSSFCP
jgi:hypothetical protein